MKTKLNLIFLSCFFSSIISSYAQMCPCQFGKSTDKPMKYEIGLNSFTYFEDLINFNSSKPVFSTQIRPGIKIKRHFNHSSLRLGFDYLENKYSYNANEPMNWNLNTGNSFSKNLKIGIEKTVINKALQVFVAADLVLKSARYSGISEGSGDFAPYYKKAYNFKLLAIGISPSLGIKYRPIERISFSLETSLSIIYWQTKGNELVYRNESNESLIMSPIGLLSINYHLIR